MTGETDHWCTRPPPLNGQRESETDQSNAHDLSEGMARAEHL